MIFAVLDLWMVALTVSFKLFKKFLTFIVLCCNKIQNGDILVPANPGPPGKWLLNGKRELALIGCGVCVWCINSVGESTQSGNKKRKYADTASSSSSSSSATSVPASVTQLSSFSPDCDTSAYFAVLSHQLDVCKRNIVCLGYSTCVRWVVSTNIMQFNEFEYHFVCRRKDVHLRFITSPGKMVFTVLELWLSPLQWVLNW